MNEQIANKIKIERFGAQFIASTKELLDNSIFEESHHYPNCEICKKRPNKNKPDEVWFVGYRWGEWFSIFICEDCILKIKNMIDEKNSERYMGNKKND